jgi:hypothetical protein
MGPDAIGPQTGPQTFQNHIGKSHFFNPQIRPARGLALYVDTLAFALWIVVLKIFYA